MDGFSKGFTRFVNVALKILLIPIVIGPITWFAQNIFTFSIIDIFFMIVVLGLIFSLHFIQKKNIKSKWILIGILLLGIGFRIIWALGINSFPTSDIKLIWECGDAFLNGDSWMFKGTGYIARFTHFTVPVLYSAFLQNIFSEPLIAAKIINVIISSLNIIIIYYIVKEIFNCEKKAQWSALATALYPPLIFYTATYFTEVLAIPFYLFSLLIFIKVTKGKLNKWWLIVTGVSLSIGNLFRMLAVIMLIAYIMYIFLYDKNIKIKLQKSAFILIAFAIPLLGVDYYLINNNITEYHLWSGRDPIWASILKGTNIEANGMWNEEDALIPSKYNYETEEVTKACQDIIIERFKTTPITDWIMFFTKKYVMQWRAGDFAGVYWSELGSNPEQNTFNLEENGQFSIQLIYLIFIILSYIGLYNKKFVYDKKEMNLLYFIYCGYALVLLITESQARYSFIVCWLFIILAFNGGEVLENLNIRYKKVD